MEFIRPELMKCKHTMDGEEILANDRREFGLPEPDRFHMQLIETAKEFVRIQDEILEAYIKQIAEGRCHKNRAAQKKKLALLYFNFQQAEGFLKSL